MTEYDNFIASKFRRAKPAGHEPGEMPGILYDFQADIVRWSVRMGRAAIFADCGLGKTFMQLAWADEAARHTDDPVLILTPPAVAEQTVAEAARMGVDARRCRDGSEIGPGINVTNYERLHRFEGLEFGGVVLDESSILKNFNGSTRTALIERFRDTPYRLACTATPAPNDHTELGNHAEFLGAMSRVEMLSMFFVHDGGSTQSWRLKRHARDEFWRWTCSWAVVVRSPRDLGYDAAGFDLPELRVETHIVGEGESLGGVLFSDAATMTIADRRRARKESLDERVSTVADMVNASADPWVIWCNLNAEGDALESAIPDSVQVTGSMDLDAKVEALESFSSGRARVIVTKPSIAGFGLNWQHASHMAFCGISDSYEQYYQAVRREWRFGQTRPVDVHVVISEAETVVAANVQGKERRAEEMSAEVVRHTSRAVLDNLKGRIMKRDEYERDVESGNGWTVHLGDSVDVVGEMESDSIGFSVFSPPFASLYTYSASDRDMGNCSTHDEFAAQFQFLVRELYRVTMPGRLVSFHCMNLPTSKVRDGVIGLSDFRGRLIRAFEAEGWIYHSEVCIWKDPVTAMQRTKALGLLHKQLKKDSCMSRQGIPDYLVTMRKPGENPERVENTNETFPVSEWQNYASPVWMDINPSDTLQASSARDEEDERHICPLQLEVIRRALRLWSKPGDLVLSPFAGIGSEGFEAIKAARRFVGVELKRTYWEQAIRNMHRAEVEAGQGDLFSAVDEKEETPA